MKSILRLVLIGTLGNAMFSGAALADGWACEVLLCLSNPQGPTAVAQCVSPIKKLWKELAKGHAFPSCFMGGSKDGNGNGAEHRFASPSYCPQGYVLPPHDENDQWHCAFSGAVTVFVSGQPTQRVWWSGEESYPESLGTSTDATQRGNAVN